MLAKKDSLVVFNAESEKGDDLMNDKEQLTSLQITINDCLKEKIGVIILAPPSLAESLRNRFFDE